MSTFNILILPGDIFGFLALGLIGLTAVFMMVRKTLLRHTKNLDLLRRTHIFISVLGGFFLILHIAYFISYPLTDAIALGYASVAVAIAVWITGTAFLERFRDTLLYHSSFSLAAIALMVIHAGGAGINIPLTVSAVMIALATAIALFKASRHASKILKGGVIRS